MTAAEPPSRPLRLFVGVWPPEAVRDRLAEVVGGFRTSHEGVRWEPPERWHVTLRFLGKVADAEPVVAALEDAPLVGAEVELGPTVGLLGRQVLCVPVKGLDDLAAAVREATAELGEPPDPRPFRGHLTLARLGGRHRQRRRRSGVGFTREWLETPVEGRWQVDAVHLVRSRPGPSGSTYDDLHVRRLDT
jgi:RNA 2',3'-cyclic 3'-phosphodiesterase